MQPVRQQGVVYPAAEDTDELAVGRPPPPARAGRPPILRLALAAHRARSYAPVQHFLVVTGVLVGGLWWLYSKLPDWLQKIIRAIWRWKTHDDS